MIVNDVITPQSILDIMKKTAFHETDWTNAYFFLIPGKNFYEIAFIIPTFIFSYYHEIQLIKRR